MADEGTRGTGITAKLDRPKIMSQQEVIARLICHVYVELTPTSGLPELCETLQDIYEFYGKSPSKEQPQLQPAAVKVKVLEPVTRPDFSVDYDEE